MARTFDGVDDQIAFGSEAAIDNISTYSACAIVRITAAITSERQILAKMDSGYVGNMFFATTGSGGNNNKIFTYRPATGADPYSESVADILAVDTWKVIVVTFDSANLLSSPLIYACTVGGAIAEVSYAANGAWVGTLEADAGATLRVGARDAADNFFQGGLAECAIWNRVLTAGEIGALGRGFSPLFFPVGRVFYTPVDGRNSPEHNLAGTTHGTLTGTTYLEHPPVIYPSMNTWGVQGTAAAPSTGQPYRKRLAGVPWMTPTRFSGVW